MIDTACERHLHTAYEKWAHTETSCNEIAVSFCQVIRENTILLLQAHAQAAAFLAAAAAAAAAQAHQHQHQQKNPSGGSVPTSMGPIGPPGVYGHHGPAALLGLTTRPPHPPTSTHQQHGAGSPLEGSVPLVGPGNTPPSPGALSALWSQWAALQGLAGGPQQAAGHGGIPMHPSALSMAMAAAAGHHQQRVVDAASQHLHGRPPAVSPVLAAHAAQAAALQQPTATMCSGKRESFARTPNRGVIVKNALIYYRRPASVRLLVINRPRP